VPPAGRRVTAIWSSMKQYYAKRAAEYEIIYQKPERQSSILEVSQFLISFFKETSVYEVACGTGYWTQFISKSAKNIIATDINNEVIEIAKEKEYYCPIEFIIADAMATNDGSKRYNSGFAGFWFSHLLKSERNYFLEKFHSNLVEGGKVCFIDNIYVEGESSKISRIDENGNTYQKRKLSNGEEYEVIKNFPTEDELVELLSNFGKNSVYHKNKYYWIISYEKK
jgi:SAM-dependent methyltransferase